VSTKIATATDYIDLLKQVDAYLTTTGHAWGKTFTGTGTGDLVDYLGKSGSVAETITITFTSATAFGVVGSTSGSLGTGAVGTPFTSTRIDFTITAGGTAFVSGDVFTINTSPKWTRLRGSGCAGANKRTSDLANVENLFDGDFATRATKAAGTGYVELEMIEPTEVREIVLGRNNVNATVPTDVRLLYKDTVGAGWTVAQTWSSLSWSFAGEAKILAVGTPGAHAFWRFEITASNTAAIDLASLVFHAMPGDEYDVAESASYVWKAPGLDGAKEILIGARTYGQTGTDTFNLGFSGLRAFDSAKGVEAQPNGTTARWLALLNSSIGFWLVANGQRFILATKASSIYQVAYCGFGNAYEPPSAHAYPLVIGASTSVRTTRYDSQSANYRAPIEPGEFGLVALYPDAQWRTHVNRNAGVSGAEGTAVTADGGKVWPAMLRADADARPTFVRENIDGSRPLLPGVLFHTAAPAHVFGEFDGYFWTTGFGTVSEAIIREGRFDHLVVQNIFRTAAQSYSAIRLD